MCERTTGDHDEKDLMADSTGDEPPGEDQDEANITEGVNTAANNNERQGVRRRLDFGNKKVEAEDLNRWLRLSSEEMYQQRQKAIEKWNFDFENEIPLDGDWKWEKISTRLPENREIVCSLKQCEENRTV